MEVKKYKNFIKNDKKNFKIERRIKIKKDIYQTCTSEMNG